MITCMASLFLFFMPSHRNESGDSKLIDSAKDRTTPKVLGQQLLNKSCLDFYGVVKLSQKCMLK